MSGLAAQRSGHEEGQGDERQWDADENTKAESTPTRAEEHDQPGGNLAADRPELSDPHSYVRFWRGGQSPDDDERRSSKESEP